MINQAASLGYHFWKLPVDLMTRTGDGYIPVVRSESTETWRTRAPKGHQMWLGKAWKVTPPVLIQPSICSMGKMFPYNPEKKSLSSEKKGYPHCFGKLQLWVIPFWLVNVGGIIMFWNFPMVFFGQKQVTIHPVGDPWIWLLWLLSMLLELFKMIEVENHPSNMDPPQFAFDAEEHSSAIKLRAPLSPCLFRKNGLCYTNGLLQWSSNSACFVTDMVMVVNQLFLDGDMLCVFVMVTSLREFSQLNPLSHAATPKSCKSLEHFSVEATLTWGIPHWKTYILTSKAYSNYRYVYEKNPTAKSES